MKISEEIKYVEKFIKYVEKGYGVRICKDLHPDCINCQSQWALGWLREHLSTVEWEMDQDKKEKK